MGSSPTPPESFKALPENVLLAAGKAQAQAPRPQPVTPSTSGADMTQPLVAGVIIGSLLS